jgi:hypothetical protein
MARKRAKYRKSKSTRRITSSSRRSLSLRNTYKRKSFTDFRGSYKKLPSGQRKRSFLRPSRPKVVQPSRAYKQFVQYGKDAQELIRRVRVCSERKRRRETLHALKKTGSGKNNRKPTYNKNSKIRC